MRQAAPEVAGSYKRTTCPKQQSPTAGENTLIAKLGLRPQSGSCKGTRLRIFLQHSPNGPAKPTKRRMPIYDRLPGQAIVGRAKVLFAPCPPWREICWCGLSRMERITPGIERYSLSKERANLLGGQTVFATIIGPSFHARNIDSSAKEGVTNAVDHYNALIIPIPDSIIRKAALRLKINSVNPN